MRNFLKFMFLSGFFVLLMFAVALKVNAQEIQTCPAPFKETRTRTCSNGLPNTIIETRTKEMLQNCEWGEWKITDGDCVDHSLQTCPTPLTETRTQACSEGQNGSIMQTRTKEMLNDCNWGEWKEINNTCAVISSIAKIGSMLNEKVILLVIGGLFALGAAIGIFYWVRKSHKK